MCQESFNGVSRVFQGNLKNFKYDSKLFQVQREFQRCIQGVSRVFQGCFKGQSKRAVRVLEGRFKGDSRKIEGCFNGVLTLSMSGYLTN